jgi:hypothetical protein
MYAVGKGADILERVYGATDIKKLEGDSDKAEYLNAKSLDNENFRFGAAISIVATTGDLTGESGLEALDALTKLFGIKAPELIGGNGAGIWDARDTETGEEAADLDRLEKVIERLKRGFGDEDNPLTEEQAEVLRPKLKELMGRASEEFKKIIIVEKDGVGYLMLLGQLKELLLSDGGAFKVLLSEFEELLDGGL